MKVGRGDSGQNLNQNNKTANKVYMTNNRVQGKYWSIINYQYFGFKKKIDVFIQLTLVYDTILKSIL